MKKITLVLSVIVFATTLHAKHTDHPFCLTKKPDFSPCSLKIESIEQGGIFIRCLPSIMFKKVSEAQTIKSAQNLYQDLKDGLSQDKMSLAVFFAMRQEEHKRKRKS